MTARGLAGPRKRRSTFLLRAFGDEGAIWLVEDEVGPGPRFVLAELGAESRDAFQLECGSLPRHQFVNGLAGDGECERLFAAHGHCDGLPADLVHAGER